jgi:hypothetical protein
MRQPLLSFVNVTVAAFIAAAVAAVVGCGPDPYVDAPIGSSEGSSSSSSGGGYGSSSGYGNGYGYEAGGPGDASASAQGDAPAPVLPPIAATPPGNAPVVCAGGSAPAAYLLALNGTLFAFDPGTLAVRALGVPSCPAPSWAQPWTLTVSPSGSAYVSYSDGNLYTFDLRTLACTKTQYVSGQLGFLGWEGITLSASNGSDRMFFYGTTSQVGATSALAVSDLTSFHLFQAGPVAPGNAPFPVDLKMDAYERLFALSIDGTLVQIDPATGAIVGEDHTGFDGVSTGGNWALMTFGDQLYFFSGPSGAVGRYDLSSKSILPVGQVDQEVVGASAVPCIADAGAAATDAAVPDAGDDGGGDAGASAAAPPVPFAAGDVWIGTYVCPQGLTDLAVTVDSVDGNTIHARFDFDWVKGGASGSFVLDGTYDPTTREATFTAGPWISQPSSSWSTVGLDGYVDLSGQELAGNVTHDGCGAFSVRR